ncbi:glycosyltransferase, partial [Chitinophaga sp.]|uniref:glycosyltransferase n=1 Tax=Chitinophaga sp. TaxID=1869181 RepID=UPI002F95B3F4
DYLIADSGGIKDYLLKTYGQRIAGKIVQIEYGSPILTTENTALLTEYGLEPNQYWLVVSRLEPENNVELIVKGYLESNAAYPLVVVGNLSDTTYVKQLQSYQGKGNIRFVNGVYNKEKLSALRYFATGYLHGHSVGGTNPSLLEAMGHGNIVVAHDNIFNREVTAGKMFYFSNEKAVAGHLQHIEQLEPAALSALREISIERIRNYYNWERIAKSYAELFSKI